MSNARRLLDDLTRQLAAQEEAARPIPTASPPGEHRRLCVGMSTYDDFDGVYFTVQSIRLHHPEVRHQTSFLVIDNHPEGRAAADLRRLSDSIPSLRYVPFRGYRGTAVRDLVFRDADADIVVCVDSHVLLEPGGLTAILEYFDAHPDSRDMVQGPLRADNLGPDLVGTHFDPNWGAGMFGQWGVDQRAADRTAEPFEIGMQGLGVFACRHDAWPGINPRFRGFGGEEGYLHEKFRQNGGRVVCLPALGWVHRFARPSGTTYSNRWVDRIRNYHFGWAEVGWDTAAIDQHFRSHLTAAEAEAVLAEVAAQVASPFNFFDGIFCLNRDDQPERWADMTARFVTLDIAWRVERFGAVAMPGRPHLGCLLSFRAMIAEARRRHYANVLVIEDDAVFLDDTVNVLGAAIAELAERPWDLLYLGGCVWSQTFPNAAGSQFLQIPAGMTCTHAVAFNATVYDRILDAIPADLGPEMDAFMQAHFAIDQYLMHRIDDGIFAAFVTAPRLATQPMLKEAANADLALGPHYII